MNKIIRKTIFTFLVLVIGSSQVFGATNIITNGSFESGTIGWTFTGATLETSAHYDGSYSVKIDLLDTIRQSISVYVSTLTTFELRYAGIQNSLSALIITFDWVDLHGNSGQDQSWVTNAENSWKLKSVNLSTLLSSAAYRLTAINIHGNFNDIYVDAVKLYQTTGGGGGGGGVCDAPRGSPIVLC